MRSESFDEPLEYYVVSHGYYGSGQRQCSKKHGGDVKSFQGGRFQIDRRRDEHNEDSKQKQECHKESCAVTHHYYDLSQSHRFQAI